MITSKLDWKGDGVPKVLFELGWESIRRAAHFFWERCVDAVNVPNTGERRRRTRTTSGGAKGTTYTVYPHPAPRGQPPHKVTGFGQRNIKEEFDKESMTARVGETVNAKYMIFHELNRHPWLLATLKKFLDQIKAHAEAPK